MRFHAKYVSVGEFGDEYFEVSFDSEDPGNDDLDLSGDENPYGTADLLAIAAGFVRFSGSGKLGADGCWVRRVFPIWSTPTRSGGPVARCFWLRWTRWCRGQSCGRWWTRTIRGPAGAVVRRSVWPQCCGSTFSSNGSPCRTARWRTGSTTSRACVVSPVFPTSRRVFPTRPRSSTFATSWSSTICRRACWRG